MAGAPYEARALANRILDHADDLGLLLTHMAVHKITYYAHGWRLAECNHPFVKDTFEAWDHGPVLPTVYASFKQAGREPVTMRASRLNLVTQVRQLASADFDAEDDEFLRRIVKAYGRLNALTLSDMTHRQGGAWDQVWNAPAGAITLGMRIKNESIRKEFIKLVPDLPVRS